MFCASRRKSIGFGLSLSRIMKCHAWIHAVIATILISPNMSYPWACFYEAKIEKHLVFPAMFFTTELLLMMVCEFIACACRNSCYRAFTKREICSDWHSCFRPPKVGDNRSPKVGDDLWQCFFLRTRALASLSPGRARNVHRNFGGYHSLYCDIYLELESTSNPGSCAKYDAFTL